MEWNVDFDKQTISVPDLFDEKAASAPIKFKGRCRSCWGNLIGKERDDHTITAIRCCICGIRVEGDEAKQEYEKMQTEVMKASFQVALRQPTENQKEGQFIAKLFPQIDHTDTKTDSWSRNCRIQEKEWLTKEKIGPPGWFVLQAHALISGVRYPRTPSDIFHLPDIELKEDGRATIRNTKNTRSSNQESLVMQALGSTMGNTLLSAFACELLMKGITLSLTDKARKTHDLHKLYLGLPNDSKERIKKDEPEIERILEQSQDTFGRWRYFERSVAETAIGVMIDYDQGVSLGRIARILLDEAETVGLGYSAILSIRHEVYKAGKHTKSKEMTHKINIRGIERMPYGIESRYFEEFINVENYHGEAYLTKTLKWGR
ncbi:MAG: hypothetical protein OXE94_02825 [Aestuariivita sp.]|nr:hypothetical protein [Aestuariivita sp.]MCY4202660.1 hypothetical protein [Aestuariivita sp.]